MMRTFSLSSAGRQTVLQALRRPTLNIADYQEKVRPIIASVRNEGDEALRHFTRAFDGVDLERFRVTEEEWTQKQIAPALQESIRNAAENIELYHRETINVPKRIQTQPGIECWQQIQPVDSVGLYVPGGTAPLISTVLMLAIPAKIAGVKRIALCTPPQNDGQISSAVLAACAMLGIDEVYSVGGAQAIAALAYGTESIAKVEKISGPGNMYVTAAKALVSIDPEGATIDMLAGPSELLIIADSSADARYIAADLLSQAEHDVLSQVILLSISSDLIQAVQEELLRQCASLPRRDIAKQALARSCAILVNTLEEAAELSNIYAPEHLSIQTSDPEAVWPFIRNAGSIFLGSNAPETVGDYCSGTNHVLPTSGFARTQSGVSVATFQKTTSVQKLTKGGLRSLRETATVLARAEGLEAHACAVDIRFERVP